MKTAVETIFVGKDRQYNRRFLQMCSHHLVEPVACTPGSGWEKALAINEVAIQMTRKRHYHAFHRGKEASEWIRQGQLTEETAATGCAT
jgi:hypothetical protein